jgi:protein subunit release factor B
MRKLLFSLTAKDFRFDTFRSGGKGGQNQNKVESGVRCTHEASKSVGTARDSRDQHRNRINAFMRCVESVQFKKWHKAECARRLGQPVPRTEEEIQRDLDEQMRSENLKEEYY